MDGWPLVAECVSVELHALECSIYFWGESAADGNLLLTVCGLSVGFGL